MDQDQGAGVQHQSPFDHLARIDRDMVDRADRQELIGDDAVLAVEIENVEPLDRPAHRQRAIVKKRLPAVDDGVSAEIAAEDVSGLEDDGFFLGGHGGSR